MVERLYPGNTPKKSNRDTGCEKYPRLRWHLVAMGVFSWSALLIGGTTSAMEVGLTQNTQRLMPYQVFELTFQHDGKYRDATWDVSIDVTFRSPSGRTFSVGGFFYGSSKPQTPTVIRAEGRGPTQATWPCEPADLWKARYAPNEPGRWKYEYVFTSPDRPDGRQRSV